jgi:hypothetical protein
MKNTAIVALIVSVIVLGLCVAYQTVRLQEQRQLVRHMNARLDSISKSRNLDLQDKCAKQAREVFKEYRQEAEQLSGKRQPQLSFRNHYHERLNKCFIEIEDDIFSRDGTWTTSRNVSDAFEGNVYASFMQLSNRDLPVDCKVKLLPSGEEKTCRSRDEYEALVRPYIE